MRKDMEESKICYIKESFLNEGFKWDKVFNNGSSEIFGRQPLKNFTWSILEYFVSNVP